MNKGNKLLTIILVCALAVGCGFAGGALSQKFYNEKAIEPAGQNEVDPRKDLTDISNASQTSETKQGTQGTPSIDISGTVVLSDGVTTVAEAIYEKVMPSVVSVTTTYEYSYSGIDAYEWFFGRGGGRSYTQEASCVGTGFIVSKDGYIVTNSHVINDGNYKKVTISLYDGTDCEGEVLWNDSTLDLAVVKINTDTKLTAVELGDSDTVKYGSYAAAIGNPLGLTFERSITQGIISGLDRTITVSSSSSSTGATIMEGLMQTDAAINSGNSGGPLLNAKGQVIGVASAKASSGESMGFAIPINTVKPIVEQIVENGSYQRVYLGIQAIGIDSQTSLSNDAKIQYYGNTTGIYIASVIDDGGAKAAGLQAGDVILKVNGTQVGSMNRLYTVLVKCKAGDQVDVSYLREGKEYSCKVTVK